MVWMSPAYGSKSKDNRSTAEGGCAPQILSAFVKQRTYQPLPTVNPLIASFQDTQKTILQGSAIRSGHLLDVIIREEPDQLPWNAVVTKSTLVRITRLTRTLRRSRFALP